MTNSAVLPPQAKNIAGQQFGRLTAIAPVGQDKHTNVLWLCRCVCGNEKVVGGSELRGGRTTSCGCLRSELAAQRATHHGMYGTPVHSAWRNIKGRCTNPNSRDYADYGARGIHVCPEWLDDFKAFYNHVAALPHFGEQGYSIDRIDNERGYEPGNVRWATARQQALNARRNVRYEYNGESLTLLEWSEKTGIAFETLRYRICRRGWPIEAALTKKPQGGNR